jgi:hypothetical protein
MLDSVEALLRSRRDKLTVNDQCCRCVGALHDSMLALIQIWPPLALESLSAMDPTKAHDDALGFDAE